MTRIRVHNTWRVPFQAAGTVGRTCDREKRSVDRRALLVHAVPGRRSRAARTTAAPRRSRALRAQTRSVRGVFVPNGTAQLRGRSTQLTERSALQFQRTWRAKTKPVLESIDKLSERSGKCMRVKGEHIEKAKL